MVTYIFQTMGKVKIDYFVCLNGDIWNLFLQKCLLSSPLLHMAFVQIAEFVARATKRVNSKKKVN